VARLKDGRAIVAVSAKTADVMEGLDDLSEWSDEELEWGQRRDKRGRWPTNRPKVIARAIHDELVKRKMRHAYDLLRENVHAAVQVLIEIATDPDVNAETRLKAASEIMNRTLGKPAEQMHLEVDARPPWMQVLEASIVPATRTVATAASLQTDVVEGEVVEEELLDDTQPWDDDE